MIFFQLKHLSNDLHLYFLVFLKNYWIAVKFHTWFPFVFAFIFNFTIWEFFIHAAFYIAWAWKIISKVYYTFLEAMSTFLAPV